MIFFCLKDRSILPKYYTRVTTLGRSTDTCSTISQDCASNTTLLTNASPFNSQQTLITNKNNKKPTNIKNNNLDLPSHYYADNLRHQNDLQNTAQIYSPLSKDLDQAEYKQLEPLIVNKDRVVIEEANILMESQQPQDEKEKIERRPSSQVKNQFTKITKSTSYAHQVNNFNFYKLYCK